MRETGFLRTPIKASQQNLIKNLRVTEQAPAANPAAADVYPQTLIVSFNVEDGTTDVEVAPLWEGEVFFLSDDTTGYPTKPEDIIPPNFDKWTLVGDLVLHTARGLLDDSAPHEEAFASHVSLIRPAPSAVRYSKVRLTRKFLFDTLSTIPRVTFVSGSTTVDKNDPKWHEKFVLGFLRGKSGFLCAIDDSDPTKDIANKDMPSVHLAPAGTETSFRVIVATRVPEAGVLGFVFFQPRPDFDDIPGVPLVPPGLNTLHHQSFNPSHPSHSVISAFALYQSASAVAYAPDHDAAKPLRVALTAPRTDGATYRRIEIIRPPAPGNAVTTWYPQRPFPQYQLAWRLSQESAIQSLRLPLTGRLYLPFIDQNYRFWVVPRQGDPHEAVVQFLLSRKQPALKYIDLPQTEITFTPIAGNNPEPLYADLLDYDSMMVWNAFFDLGSEEINKFRDKAKETWNISANRWIVHPSPAMKRYGRVYGKLRAAAGRHGFAPEFLHAVFMGEGPGATDDPTTPERNEDGLIELNRKDGIDYVDWQVIDSFVDLGLDVIRDTIGSLIANGYLDSSFSADQILSNPHPVENELGQIVTAFDIAGWEAGIELVAAELNSRRDEILAYCASKGITVTTEEQRRFLTYMMYNRPASAREHAEHLDQSLRPWTGAPPPGRRNPRFNTLKRLTATQWYELAGVYR